MQDRPNRVQTAVETLLFYHPAVWWVSHRMRVERELCEQLVDQPAHLFDPLGQARSRSELEYERAPGRAQGLVDAFPVQESVIVNGNDGLVRGSDRAVDVNCALHPFSRSRSCASLAQEVTLTFSMRVLNTSQMREADRQAVFLVFLHLDDIGWSGGQFWQCGRHEQRRPV
mgnify:CR=1 FL=1